MFWKTIYYAAFVSLSYEIKTKCSNIKDVLILITLCIIFLFLCLICGLALAAYLRRSVILLHANTRREFNGKPLLFPAKLSHARRFPVTERYNYWYDYFLVGVPVGFRGRIGNLLSIDNNPTEERPEERCWFTIDPTYYLDRGSGSRSLEEKLHIFLKSQGENPCDYPYAYLISVPRFLCFQKSAISYWYLYSPTRELTAMIMEINNSFYEKRNVFFRLAGDERPADYQPIPTEVTNALIKDRHDMVSLNFLPPGTKSKNYKGSWEKLIFGSPFEKVGGLMTAKFVDPLVGPSLHSNLSSNTADGQVKVTSRLASWSEPLDPVTATSYSVAKFITRWTHVGVVSAPRIVYEALRVRFRGNLQYLQRPEVRIGSVPRKETEVERVLELSFREYLSKLASHCPFPLSIRYRPPRSLHFNDIMFHSQLTPTSHPRPILDLQPLSSRFYTFFSDYEHPEDGFVAAITPDPTNSDKLSCLLSVSDPVLMNRVLSATEPLLDKELQNNAGASSDFWDSSILQKILLALRRSRRASFLDRLSFSYFTPSRHRAYMINAIHYRLARLLPIESQAIVELCFILSRTILIYHFMCLVNFSLSQHEVSALAAPLPFTPVSIAAVYGGWDMTVNYIGKYYLNPFAWGEGL